MPVRMFVIADLGYWNSWLYAKQPTFKIDISTNTGSD